VNEKILYIVDTFKRRWALKEWDMPRLVPLNRVASYAPRRDLDEEEFQIMIKQYKISYGKKVNGI
jgi:hypothetical protein